MSERDDDRVPGTEPLDPELAALLEADRAHDAMPDGAPARLWGKLERTLPSGGGGGGSPPASPPTPTPASALGAASLATHALVLVIGAAAGALMHAALATPVVTPIVTTVVAPSAPTPPAAPAPPRPIDPSPAPTTVVAVPDPVPALAERPPPPRRDEPAVTAPPPEAPPRTSTLASERVGLEIARTAIGRGEYDHALEALTAHEQDFPSSRVAEEREVLFVRALAGAGRAAEAHARATRFRERYPDSLFLPAIAAL